MVRHTKGAGVKPAPFFIAGYLLLQGFTFSVCSFAEVPVVEIEDRETATAVSATATVAPSANATAVVSMPTGSRQNQLSEIFIQMQQLQHEVQELRGIVEQQGFEIQTLKQQVKDNYLDLDKRISALPSGATTSSAGSNSVASDNTNAVAESATSGAEKDSYDSAYKLLDQNLKDDAIVAFRKHVALYPKGDLAANAYYWMGQIYLTQSQLDLSQEQFATLLKNFPDHRKVPDAKFALGKVYFQQGKKVEAKKIIQEVSQGDSKAAALAKTFLQDNF